MGIEREGLDYFVRHDDSSFVERERARPLYVMKFGGTSMGGASQITSVVEIISEQDKEGRSLIIVPSAMSGVTNLLESTFDGVAKGDTEGINRDLRTIFDRHLTTTSEIRLDHSRRVMLQDNLREYFVGLRNDVDTALNENLVDAKSKDNILSYGEQMSSRILEAKCLQEGLNVKLADAFSIIKTNDNFGEAKVDFEMTKVKSNNKIGPLLDDGSVIIPGFIGSTEDKIKTTLGRGGSDYTASILGWALDAKEVWIWTDVSGMYSDDPRENSDAKLISEMSYYEADEKAKSGAKVLYQKTLEPLFETDIILRIKNTFDPSSEGTKIARG